MLRVSDELAELKARYERLRLLYQVSNVIHSTLDSQEALERIIREAVRIMRASMLEVLSLDFVRTARSKGLAETAVVVRHVLRNALLPMVTLVGLQAGTMLGGSVVVESVFALPGLGRLAYESVVQRDLNTLLGIVFISALLVIIINFVVDMAYARLDPRIGAGR